MTPIRTLIVDDSPANLKLARVALEGHAYEVVTASDGEEAWRILSSYLPDVILLDLQLPGLDGYELAKRIKADSKLRQICVIAVTAYAMRGDRDRAIEAGCDGYLTKPIDPITLPAQIADQLRRPAPEPGAGGADRPAILVVEDNPTTRKMIRVALESDGHRVCEAGDGATALRLIEIEPLSLILQDLVLPDLDGLDLLMRFRAHPKCADTVILCLSGFQARMDEARAQTHGFSALLLKPVDPIQLLATVRSHLQPASRPPTANRSRHGRTLLVENDPLHRRLALFHFAEAGFDVDCVDSANAALDLAERSPPAIIVSDIVMPGMDGFELCLTLRAHASLSTIPVILVSSYYTDSDNEVLARQIGASAIIGKSGDWAEVIECVRETLAHKPDVRGSLPIDQACRVIMRRTAALLERQTRLNKELNEQRLLQEAQLSVLAGASATLARSVKAKDILGDVLAVCLDLAGISKGALYLRHHGEVKPTHWIGWRADEVEGLSRFFGHASVLEQVLTTGESVALPSFAVSPKQAQGFLKDARLQAALVVPVAWGESRYGVLLLGTTGGDTNTHEPTAFARALGAQLGQALGLADAFEQLRASEEELRGLVGSMDLVTVIDRELRVVAVHGRITEADGIDRQSYVGQRFDEVPGVLDQDIHRNMHARALAGESLMYEWSYLSGANLRHYQSSVFPLRDAHGDVSSVVRVSRDVTEQKRMQAQIMVSDRMASIGMLAAGVAHEINNPLMAVRGNLELALEGLGDSISPDTRDMLNDAFDASGRVEAIVRDLRLFSRTESEQHSSVDVNSVLDSMERMARNEIRHRARLVKRYQPVPLVRASEARLGQVFLNLLVNAAQAIPDGRADANEITLATEHDTNHVMISISDTGVGISQAQAAKLFTPFVTTKAPGLGTGLGLAICKRIVNGLGGTIDFTSEVGRGTTFRIVLPVDRAPVMAQRQVAVASTPRRRGQVLIVDDDVSVGTVARRALANDHDVTVTSDASHALEVLTAGAEYDVILCDLMMPVVSGPEFHAALTRTRPELADRVVFLTGGAFTPAARDFMERMHERCLEKPLDVHMLRAAINQRVV